MSKHRKLDIDIRSFKIGGYTPKATSPKIEKIELEEMKVFPAALLVFALAGSCQKSEPGVIESNAILKWRGDYQVDGCGFFIIIGTEEYKPENESFIDDSFKTSSEEVEVIIQYEKLEKEIKSFCEWGIPKLNKAIKIVSIKRK